MMFIILPLIFFSCSENNTAVLWSGNEEAADIVELYNSSNNEYRIIFQYRENLVSSYIKSDKKPDLIIGEDLQNRVIKSDMLSLNKLPGEAFPLNEALIPALTEGICIGDDKKILPLSFTLSTAVFNKNSKRIDRTLPSYDLELMKENAISYNREQKSRGYSPYWDNDFIFTVLELYGSSFSSAEGRTLAWNREKMDSAVEFMADWNERNGGQELIAAFNDKFLYENRIKLLKDEKILLTTMDSSDFMTFTDSMSRDLDFLYISRANQLHPRKIIYGGISKKTSSRQASSDFLLWLLEEETQREIIESSLRNKTGGFAILGGFSSLIEVNRFILPQFYPRLSGKIPDHRYILPQSEKPLDFTSMRDELLTPWVLDRVEGNAIELSDALEKWEKLRIPF